MVRVLRFVAALLAWVRSSQARREAEILYLRQQLIILKRSAPARPRLKATDRLIFVCLYTVSAVRRSSSISPARFICSTRCLFANAKPSRSRLHGGPAAALDLV